MDRRRFLRNAAAASAASACAWPAAAPATLPPHMQHEAAHYTKLDGGKTKCGLCPRQCVVDPGKRGHCGVRENRDGTYYSLVYGQPVCANNDPIEKKPFFHVLPGSRAFSIASVGCNIHCKFCQNWEISTEKPENVHVPYVAPAAVAAHARQAGARLVAYTYSEPTVSFEYVSDCARAARDLGLGNVMVSNGFIQAKPLKELIPLMTAYKVDLKAFSQQFYAKVCEGRLRPVLDTLKRLADSGLWFEIVVLTIPTLNDNLDEIKRMADWIVKELGPSVPLHFTRFHPDYKLRNLPRTPIKTLTSARRIAMDAGCRFVYTGNMPGGEGENTRCPTCGSIVLKRYGHFVVSNDLKAGVCSQCRTRIPGVWS